MVSSRKAQHLPKIYTIAETIRTRQQWRLSTNPRHLSGPWQRVIVDGHSGGEAQWQASWGSAPYGVLPCLLLPRAVTRQTMPATTGAQAASAGTAQSSDPK